MRYKPYLSQNEHLLVLKCAIPLEVCEDSSSQHGPVGDARAIESSFLLKTVTPISVNRQL
jgi:hypothetical protein